MERDFDAFCVQAWPRLVAALSHYTGDRLLAEELAQESLIRAGARWPQVSALASPTGWTFRVGANLASSHFRRRAAEGRALRRHGVPPLDVTDAAQALAVRAALMALPERQRRAVVLRYFLDLTPDEAGEAMGVSGQAVRNLTHRAIITLRDEFALDEEPLDVR